MLIKNGDKTVAGDSVVGYGLFAFVAMVGLAYVNFLPGVVSALAGGIGFSDVEAGQIVAANGYGGLFGSAIAIVFVRHIQWKTTMLILLTLLTLTDMFTALMPSYYTMLGCRFIAGILGGLCVGVAFSALARLNSPDKAFGYLLFMQFIVGAIVMYSLPMLETALGHYAVFYVLVCFGGASIAIMSFLPALPSSKTTKTHLDVSLNGTANIILLMLAIVFYLCAANAIWAYIELIGLEAGMDDNIVASYIASTGMLGLCGALIPMMTAKRFGRLFWVVAGVVLSVIASGMLYTTPLTATTYVVAMALLFFSWPAVNSYLLAVTAELDPSGRLSTVAAVISQLGLASGPLMASGLIDSGDFSTLLLACAAIFILSLLLLVRPVKAVENNATAYSSQYQS